MKKTIAVILLFLSTALITSCWSRREIENLGFVMGIGVSKTDQGLYSVVVQVANPNTLAAEAPKLKEVYTIIKSEGPTIFDAIRNLSMTAKRRLYIAHINSVVIDESVAREGLRKVVSFLVQDMEVRLESEVFISKIPPEDIYDTPNYLGMIPAMGLSIIAQNFGANNKIYVSDLHQTVDAVNNPVINYVTSLVEKIEPPSGNEKPELELAQIAVFDDDRLIGYLDWEEGQAYNFITNNFKNGLITFENAPKNDRITIEGLSSKAKITPGYKDGKVSFDIEVKVQGNVAERITEDVSFDELDIELLQQQLNEVIKKKLNKAIDNAQQKFEIDYFNFSKYFFRKYPKEFKSLKGDWNKVFSNADISVKVESTILHSALNLNRERM